MKKSQQFRFNYSEKWLSKRWISFALFVALVLAFTTAATRPLHAASDKWDVSYWNNKTLNGAPVVQRQESSINYSWGHGSPVQGVNNDNFSVRWTRSVYFPASGTYRFTATMDDGMRVWIDNALIIDSWYDSQEHTVTYDAYLNTGDHTIKVEYYDAGGVAVAKLSWAQISGSGTVPISAWKGEYFNNKTLSGSPVLVRDDQAIDFDWGGGSPLWGTVASDNFSARWTRNLALEGGRYRFTVQVDDGVRLWVNGRLLIDQWHDAGTTYYIAEIDLPGGAIPVQMEYYENLGGAVARLHYDKISGTGGAWRGEYFNNRTLSGQPAVVRNDANVNFNWGSGSPATGISADNFSVRWTRSLAFVAGRYRFTATSDDGVRVWVNGQLVINNWSDHPPQTVTGEIDLPNGTIPLVVEYYENTGGAQVSVNWTAVSAPAPQPTPVPAPGSGAGIVVSPRLNVRTGPGTQYSILSVLSYHQTVNLTGYRSADAGWVQIHWNGGTAWVSGKPYYLQTSVPVVNMPVWTGSGGTGGPQPTGPTATVGYVYYLNVRTGPGTAHSVITAVPAGTIVELIGRNSSSTWAKARLQNGIVGWMSAGYLISNTPISALPVVN